MRSLESVIKTYAQALKDNDYHTMITLFSQDAQVHSGFGGQQAPSDFFKNLFGKSRRTQVEIKNILLDVDDNKRAAAYIYLEVLWNQKTMIQFEAVDIFEFDQENKVKNLKIIFDTYPVRKLKEKSAASC